MKEPVEHKVDGLGPNTKMKVLEWWQRSSDHPPIICVEDDAILEPEVTLEGTVFLQCPNCDYIQTNLPQEIFNRYFKIVALGMSVRSHAAIH